MAGEIVPSAELLMRAAAASDQAVHAGHQAPAFRLPDLRGGRIALVELIAKGPLVISFYRGIWCSFCALALEALARTDEDIRAAGAVQIAIGPPPDTAEQEQRLKAFPMPVLLDRDLRVAASYGLTIDLPVALRPRYIETGYVPPASRSGDQWPVPIPATYIVDRNGRVALASIDADYRGRLEPAQLLSALRGLTRRVSAAVLSK